MTHEPLRAAELDEYRETTWAITPPSLPLIAGLAGRGHIDVAAARELHAALAADRSERGTSGRGIAVLSLQGVIMPGPSLLGMLLGAGGGLQEFRANLSEALADDSVGGIVLDIDSPGGSTDQVTETAEAIRAARQAKPVIAVANTWAGSAAYWLAAQADEIVITPSGEAGSIGVFVAHEDISALEERVGVKTTLISAGKHKIEGNPFEALTDDARAAMQQRVDEFYGLFVADVAKGRGVTANKVRSGFGEGRMLTAKNAVADGLADRIDTIDNVIGRMARRPAGAARRRSATTDLPPAATAAEAPEPDNPDPNDTPVSEEGRARIAALLAEHPRHVQETTS